MYDHTCKHCNKPIMECREVWVSKGSQSYCHYNPPRDHQPEIDDAFRVQVRRAIGGGLTLIQATTIIADEFDKRGAQ